MKIYRFRNGDTCPCCAQSIPGKSPEELAEFSVLIYGVASALNIADWIYNPGENAIEISPEALRSYLSGEEAPPDV